MDVLKPELLYISGRCFRLNPTNIKLHEDSYNSVGTRNYTENQSYEDEDCYVDDKCGDDNEEEHLCKIELFEGKRCRTIFHIARTYFPYIIGTKGATRKRLETETKTQIIVPRLGQEGDIIITGNTKSSVLAAYRRINMIVMTVRRRQQYTHFISIPVCGAEIKKRFLEFKRTVLEKCNDRGIEESVFQSPDRLHLTLCTMVLSDDVERNNAVQILQKCKSDVIDDILNGEPLKLRISGIEIMNDDPAEVNVVYGRVHSDDIDLLEELVDSIVNYCANAGIIEKEYKKVKLHITLMNTKFHNSPSIDFNNDGKKNRETINAANVLKNYIDYDFGEEIVNTIHLSQMGTASNSGYYKASLILNLS